MRMKVTWEELRTACQELETIASHIGGIAYRIRLDDQPAAVKKWIGHRFSGRLPTHGDALIGEAAKVCNFAAWEEANREPLRQLAEASVTFASPEKVFIDQATGKKYRVIEEEA